MTSAFSPINSSACTFTLDKAKLLQPLTVISVSSPFAMGEWRAWLEEIGFLPGEPVMVMARAMPGADPLVVRVGVSTFALRRNEAACITVLAHNTDTSQQVAQAIPCAMTVEGARV